MKTDCYTHDLLAPAWFLDKLQAMPGVLDCRWNRPAARFDILELDKLGRWSLVLSIDGRMPDARDLVRLERAQWQRERSIRAWFENNVAEPNRSAEQAAIKAADEHTENVVTDNIRFIMDVPSVGYDSQAATGLKEISRG